jgi:hypothetical protein
LIEKTSKKDALEETSESQGLKQANRIVESSQPHMNHKGHEHCGIRALPVSSREAKWQHSLRRGKSIRKLREGTACGPGQNTPDKLLFPVTGVN